MSTLDVGAAATYLEYPRLKHMGIGDHFDCRPGLQTLDAPRTQRHTERAKEHVNARRGCECRGQVHGGAHATVGVSLRLTARLVVARGSGVRFCANLAGAAFQACDDAQCVPGPRTQVTAALAHPQPWVPGPVEYRNQRRRDVDSETRPVTQA
jgi:hypothetical protein